MKLNQNQITALRMAEKATFTNPVTVVGARRAGSGPIESMNEIASATARSLERRGLVTVRPGRENAIHGEDYVYVTLTDAGREALASLGGAEKPADTPEHPADCPECRKLVPKAKEKAQEYGVSEASYRAGEHEGVWKA